MQYTCYYSTPGKSESIVSIQNIASDIVRIIIHVSYTHGAIGLKTYSMQYTIVSRHIIYNNGKLSYIGNEWLFFRIYFKILVIF